MTSTLEIIHVDFEKYAILKNDILYLIFVDNETVFITANMIYKSDIVISDFQLFCVTPMNVITIKDKTVLYKEFDRYIVQSVSAYTTAVKLSEYLRF